ncbi:MAG: oxygen-dependent coproporphyrinogen oxidase [Flavobacteriaceae bacterium]
MKEKFYPYIVQLQDQITKKLESLDHLGKFKEEKWERPGGGGGQTRVLEGGAVFEKAGVNISAVHGTLPPSMQAYLKVAEATFYACGLSLVIHPKNPMIPTVHANFRYFEMYDTNGMLKDQWFGGGMDLTPYYLFEEDVQHFHQCCKNSCDAFNTKFYSDYKEACDRYFWNAHRNEARGVGGLFFDYLKPTANVTLEDRYKFVTTVGDSFLNAYVPIVQKRKDYRYTPQQRMWQEIRRGRYVEFNLIHDKGTLFGLQTKGRIESILMSLPAHVQWKYDYHPTPNSEEAALIEVLKSPKNWV